MAYKVQQKISNICHTELPCHTDFFVCHTELLLESEVSIKSKCILKFMDISPTAQYDKQKVNMTRKNNSIQ